MYSYSIIEKKMVKDSVVVIVDFTDGFDTIRNEYSIKHVGDFEVLINDTLATELQRINDLKNLANN